MSTIYRKSGGIGRMLYKVDDQKGLVIRVLNKQLHSSIEFSENMHLVHDILEDNTTLKTCTESEFNAAFKEAMERITSGIV